jgi:hypothetical protein
MEDQNKNINNIPGCSDFVEEISDKNLEQLEEIGKEINQLEKKLEAIPGAGQTDLTKYNRKQRRQMQRKMIHNEKEKQKVMEQKGATFVTRKEFVTMFQSAQKLRDRLYYVDVLVAAIEKLLLEKNIITEEEIKKRIESETEKAVAFQEIQKGEKDYENRLKRCLELQIDPNISNIGHQLYEDASIDIKEKLRLAREYNIVILLKILEEQDKKIL